MALWLARSGALVRVADTREAPERLAAWLRLYVALGGGFEPAQASAGRAMCRTLS